MIRIPHLAGDILFVPLLGQSGLAVVVVRCIFGTIVENDVIDTIVARCVEYQGNKGSRDG